MRVTPLDILQRQFQSVRKGYDEAEVRAFLDATRESMEELLRENQRLREDLARRDAEIAALREAESDLKSTLTLARRLSEDLHRGARREADVVVGEARLEAERILQSVADERRDLSAEVIQLRATRARLGAELRAVVLAHTRFLDEWEREGGLLG